MIDSMDFEMMRVDWAYRRYMDAIETSRFYDSLEAVYEAFDEKWKAYWGRFSKAYAEGSEFYSEDFPVGCFWCVILVATLLWYKEVMIDEVD